MILRKINKIVKYHYKAFFYFTFMQKPIALCFGVQICLISPGSSGTRVLGRCGCTNGAIVSSGTSYGRFLYPTRTNQTGNLVMCETCEI